MSRSLNRIGKIAKWRVPLAATLFWSVWACAWSAQPSSPPVKAIPIFVQPYYESARSEGTYPSVRVGSGFNSLLESSDPKAIMAARDKVQSAPELVTPMTMMVLSIRLYDVGLRDESVFWFYAAKNRFYVAKAVLDFDSGSMSVVADTMNSFISLAGPFINGYAFCDVEGQKKTARKALDWTREHPYMAHLNSAVPRKAGDPELLRQKALAKGEDALAKEAAWIEDPVNREKFESQRLTSSAKEKFCQ